MNNTNQLLQEIQNTEIENLPKDDLYDTHKHALKSHGINWITDLIKLGGNTIKNLGNKIAKQAYTMGTGLSLIGDVLMDEENI